MTDRTMALKFAAWIQSEFGEGVSLIPRGRSFGIRHEALSENEIEVLQRAFMAGYKSNKNLIGMGFVTTR